MKKICFVLALMALPVSALALENLDVRITIDDNVATVTADYENDDGDDVRETFTFTDIRSVDDAYDATADELGISASEVEAAARVTADDSIELQGALDAIDDAEEALTGAYDALETAKKDDTKAALIDEAKAMYREANDLLDDANEEVSYEDFDTAIEKADLADDTAREIFDLLGYDEDDFIGVSTSDRSTQALNAIDAADQHYHDVLSAKNKARLYDAEVNEAETLLATGKDLIHDAEDLFDDELYIQARETAEAADDILSEAEAAIGDYEIPENPDRIELVDDDYVKNPELQDDADAALSTTQAVLEEAQRLFNAFPDDHAHQSARGDAGDTLSSAYTNRDLAQNYYEDKAYAETIEYADRAQDRARIVFVILGAEDQWEPFVSSLTAPEPEPEPESELSSGLSLMQQLQSLLIQLVSLLQQKLQTN